jgi:hypothetical protein
MDGPDVHLLRQATSVAWLADRMQAPRTSQTESPRKARLTGLWLHQGSCGVPGINAHPLPHRVARYLL